MAQSVKLKRSSVVSGGSPKLPTAAQLEVGEMAINFAEGYETLSTKNSNNGIATFSSDGVLDKKYIASGAVVSALSAISVTIEDNEYVIAQAFNEQDERISELEDAGFITGFTETDPTVPAWAKATNKPSYTASEVGAMATSERSNYLGTGTTLDNIADGSTRKLANYSLTSHTHSEYSSTGHSHTASEVGALPTGTTLDNIADGTSRKLSNYALTGHTHDNYSLTSHTHSNYATTANVSTLSSSTQTHINNTGIHLPAVTASDNGKVAMVVNGQWSAATPVTVYSGSIAPDNVLGNNGDIYLQTS